MEDKTQKEKIREVVIDNSAYGKLKSLLGAMNLDVAKPWVDELVKETEERLVREIEGKKFEKTESIELEKYPDCNYKRKGLYVGNVAGANYNQGLDDAINLIRNK